MKKIIILFPVLFTYLFANIEFEISLYEKIFPLVFQKKILKIYGDKRDTNIFKNSSIFLIVKNCKESDFIFGNIRNYDDSCSNVPKFVKSYKLYKSDINVFGAFYWRKGRPQLKFKESVMEKFNLYIPDIIKEYIQ